jgi:hypothetical protein
MSAFRRPRSVKNEELLDRLVALQIHVEQLEERCDAYEDVLFWLLERSEGEAAEASSFLSSTANNYEDADGSNDPPKFVDVIGTLDLLRERIAELRVQQRPVQ